MVKKLLQKIWYAGEEGLIQGVVRENTTDSEGQWVGVEVTGTPIHQLRTFVLTSPRPDPIVYLSRQEHPPGARLATPGLGYLLAYRDLVGSDQVAWADNCQSHREFPDENMDLRDAARKMGMQPHPGAPGPQGVGVVPHGEESKDPPKEKKLKGKQKVKKMLETAKWSFVGTPLDPHYKKPIKIRVKKKGAVPALKAPGMRLRVFHPTKVSARSIG